ncbi:epoxyqueuosine reductase QueH [Sutterella seckii]|uniref:Epoxyqueuosine reductase QueH n=1 Tax=Sutterella seckii TaxID=1944635 RepID=A0A6I1ETB0_9BURK|nr:epoxyqueuosine reductase QueH [Sutterella seckii]KAB7662004.1 epoxyqueuosine reductase QueH [Sutterella seckii]MBS5216688.1 epoxyqueuosine reductase QueH [Sutterella wadsworthensis]
MPRPVLLHSCCAPCSSAILEWLLQHDYAPTIFYFNPNIFPQEEYLVRKNECQRYAAKLGVPFVDGDYDHALWREAVKGLENEPERGARCRVCFGVRMLATARTAKRLGIESFTTTLAGSRWKRLEQIREAAEEAARLTPGTAYWDMNWRKGGLQQRRGELLKEEGFYNQLWCGCEFSMGHLALRPIEEIPVYAREFVLKLGAGTREAKKEEKLS